MYMTYPLIYVNTCILFCVLMLLRYEYLAIKLIPKYGSDQLKSQFSTFEYPSSAVYFFGSHVVLMKFINTVIKIEYIFFSIFVFSRKAGFHVHFPLGVRGNYVRALCYVLGSSMECDRMDAIQTILVLFTQPTICAKVLYQIFC